MASVGVLISSATSWAARSFKDMLLRIFFKAAIADLSSAELGLATVSVEDQGFQNKFSPRPSPSNESGSAENPASTTETPTPTPNSSNESRQTRGSIINKHWRRLSNTFPKNPFSPTSEEQKEKEEEELRRQREYDKIIDEPYHVYPKGIPRLAGLMNSGKNLSMHRRFGSLHERILLHSEIELTQMEAELREVERKIEEVRPRDRRLISTLHDRPEDKAHKKLLDEIKIKLKDYDDTLARHHSFQTLPCPAKRDHLSLFHEIVWTKPLAGGYYDHIYHVNDLVTPFADSNSFESMIGSYIFDTSTSLLEKFTLKPDKKGKADEETYHKVHSEASFQYLAGFLVVCLIIALLLVPMYLLFLVPMDRPMMAGTVTSFLIPFSFIVLFVPDEKLYKVLIASSNFGAVLIMFLGNVVQNSKS